MDAGFTYTVTPAVTGTYDGLTPQTVLAESTEVILCQFDLRTPRALDSAVVHKTGAEAVGGVKMFTNAYKVVTTDTNARVDVKFTDISDKTNPDVNHYCGFNMFDGAHNEMPGCFSAYYSNGHQYTTMIVHNHRGDEYKHARIDIRYTANGDIIASAPTPTNNKDNSGKIATTEWVTSADCVVHRSKNEEILGEKTFKSVVTVPWNGLKFISENSAFDNRDQYSEYGNLSIRARGEDIDGQPNYLAVGYLISSRNLDTQDIRMINRVYESNTVNRQASVGVSYNKTSKQFWGYAPETPNGANSNEIVTAGWANGHYQPIGDYQPSGDYALDSEVVHRSLNEDILGDKTFKGSITTNQDYPVINEVIYKIPTPSDNPPSQAIGGLRIASKNNGYLGQFCIFYETNGDRKLLCTVPSKNGTIHEIGVFTDKNGNAYGIAPTTPEGANNKEIVTAGYLNTKLDTKMDENRITVSGSSPSGGNDGDIWIQV